MFGFLGEVLSRIFQREETSSTSSGLSYEKRSRRKPCDGSSKENGTTNNFLEGHRKEKETNTIPNEAENKDKRIHFEDSKKTEKSLLPPFQSRTRGTLKEGQIAYLNQSKIPPKKSSVEIQVCKDGETNGELISFSPRRPCHHKRDVCGLQQKITDSSDFGGSRKIFFPNKCWRYLC